MGGGPADGCFYRGHPGAGMESDYAPDVGYARVPT